MKTGLAAGLALASAVMVLASTLARAQDPPAQAQPPADPATIVQGACTACHGLDFIAQHRKDRDGWDFTVRRMIDKGADLDVDAVPLVVDYLARTYPKPAESPPA